MWPEAPKSPDPDHMGHLEGKNKCPWNVMKTQKTLSLRLSLHSSVGGGHQRRHLRGMAWVPLPLCGWVTFTRHCHKADQGARRPLGRGRREGHGGVRPHPRCDLKQGRSSLHRRTLQRESGVIFFVQGTLSIANFQTSLGYSSSQAVHLRRALTLPTGHISGPRPRAKSVCQFQEP